MRKAFTRLLRRENLPAIALFVIVLAGIGWFQTININQIEPAAIPLNLLTFSNGAHPIDPTFTVDSTAGINAALAVVCNPTVRYNLFVPHGKYKLSATLVCTNGLEPHITGEGRDVSIFWTTGAIPQLQLVNNFRPVVDGIGFVGDPNAPPTIAIESRVSAPVLNWPENSGTIQNVGINIPQPSGTPSTILEGIVFDHDLSGCGFNGNNSCDANNDQWMLLNDDVDGTVWDMQVVGGNAEWETIIGGHWGVPGNSSSPGIGQSGAINLVGGSVNVLATKLTGTGTGSNRVVMYASTDSNPLDFPYLKPSYMRGIGVEGVQALVRSDPTTTYSGPYTTSVYEQMYLEGIDGTVGISPPAATLTVNTSPTLNAITATSGTFAGFGYGDRVIIGGTTYFLGAITDSTHAVLQSSAGTQTGVSAALVGSAVDWEAVNQGSQPPNLTLRDVNLSLGNGGLIRQPDSAGRIELQNVKGSLNEIDYGGCLTELDTNWTASSALPVLNYIGGGTDCRNLINVTQGGVVQPVSFSSITGVVTGQNIVNAQVSNCASGCTYANGTNETNMGEVQLAKNFAVPRTFTITANGFAKSGNASTCTMTIRFSNGTVCAPGTTCTTGNIVAQTGAAAANTAFSARGVVQFNSAGTSAIQEGDSKTGTAVSSTGPQTTSLTPASTMYVNINITNGNAADTCNVDSANVLIQ